MNLQKSIGVSYATCRCTSERTERTNETFRY